MYIQLMNVVQIPAIGALGLASHPLQLLIVDRSTHLVMAHDCQGSLASSLTGLYCEAQAAH